MAASPLPGPALPPSPARRRRRRLVLGTVAVVGLVLASGLAVAARSGRSGSSRRPVSLLVAGDSTAGVLGGGLRRWALERPGRADVEIVGDGGCAFLQEGLAVLRDGWTQPPSYGCTILVDYIVTTATRSSPDAIVLFLGSAELSDWLLPGREEPSAIGEPDFDRRYTEAVEAALTTISGVGIPILVTTTPVPSWDPTRQTGNTHIPGQGPIKMNDAGRTRRLNELTTQAVRGQPLAEMVPYAERIGGADRPVAADLRPDGVHLKEEIVPGIMAAGLEGDLRAAYRRVTARRAAAARGGANRWST